MDIEEWYAADHRRRQGRELAYGMGWAEGSPPRWLADLFWNDETGELFLLRKPVPPSWLPIVSHDDLKNWLGDLQEVGAEVVEATRQALHPRHRRARAAEADSVPPAAPDSTAPESEDDEADIEPLGVVTSRVEIDRILAGWQVALTEPDSLSWLRGRLRQAGAAGPAGAVSTGSATLLAGSYHQGAGDPAEGLPPVGAPRP
ncbi:MAG: hypothetical protein DLM54_01745 [Acidimicrobiales bacterium]|nr:MAG: hypothetical protein DLM54_01745 [Acidimicrobiales bacterium]